MENCFFACGSGSSPPNPGNQKLGSPTYHAPGRRTLLPARHFWRSETRLEVRDTFGGPRHAWRSETRPEVRDTSGGPRHVRYASVSPTRGYFFTGSDLQTRLEVRGVGFLSLRPPDTSGGPTGGCSRSALQTRPEVRRESFFFIEGEKSGMDRADSGVATRWLAQTSRHVWRPEAACFTVDLQRRHGEVSPQRSNLANPAKPP